MREIIFYLSRHWLFIDVLVRIAGRRGLKICDFLARTFRGQLAMVTHEDFVGIDLFLGLKFLIRSLLEAIVLLDFLLSRNFLSLIQLLITFLKAHHKLELLSLAFLFFQAKLFTSFDPKFYDRIVVWRGFLKERR